MRFSRRAFLGTVASGIALTGIETVTAENSDRARYIVTSRDRGVRRHFEREGFEIISELADGEVLLVVGPDEATDDLERIPGVRGATPDVKLEVDLPVQTATPDESLFEEQTDTTLYPLQWGKQVQEVLAAHEYATGEGSTLAILDTGIDPDHPDLEENVNKEQSALFSSGNPIDDNPWDMHAHGTHVSGTAAATQDSGADGTGIVGTAPDATLVSAKVFWFEDPEGHEDEDEPFLTTTTGDILEAIDYAAEIGADAANMSLGTPPLPPQARSEGMHVAYQRVIQHATRQGTLVIASAGNADTNLQQGGLFVLPTSTPGAMSVSATGPNDLRAFYSNYGTNEIDVGAPGGGYETEEKTLDPEADVEWPYPTNLVLSSVPPEVVGVPYAYFAGTSMASPQVTGLVGLVRELNPDANANQVEQAIKHGAEGTPGQSDPDLGAGRTNALNTVERIDRS